MNYILIAVKDRAVDSFQPVFCVRAIGEAIRNFQDAVNNPENRLLHNHPDDHDLYQLGTYDDQTGRIESHEPKLLILGKQAIVTAPGGITITAPNR